MGILDQDPMIPAQTAESQRSARNTALLAAGLSMLANSRGRSLGEAIGQGGMAGLNAYGSALEHQQQQAMQQLKSQQIAQQFAAQQKVANLLSGQDNQTPSFQGQAVPTISQAQRYRLAGDMYAAADPVKAKAYYEIADKLSPKASSPGSVMIGPNGEVVGSLPNIEKGVGPDTESFNRDFANMAARLSLLEGRKAQATERAKAGFDPQVITRPEGRPRMMTREQIVEQATGQQAFPRVSPDVQAQRDAQAGNLLINEYGSVEAAKSGLASLDKELANKSLQGDARAMLQGQRNRLVAGLSQLQQPQSVQQIGIPLQSSAEKIATDEMAKKQVEFRAGMPKAEQQAGEAIKQIDELLNHPGFKTAVGKSSMFGIQKIPGTDAYDFMSRFGQVKSGAFLQAFEMLKGGGAITQIEGEKATAAKNRMDNATSEQEFIAAAKDFQNSVRTGVNKLKQQAGIEDKTSAQEKTVVKRGTYNGKRVVQYSDGSMGYE